MTDIEKVARAMEAESEFCVDAIGSGNMRNLAKAAIAAMQPAPQWKWIGSAPRNGTCVLLWIPAEDGRHAYIASGWYESGVFDNRWYAAPDENPLSPQPTHWMPLPTPPAGGSDAER